MYRLQQNLSFLSMSLVLLLFLGVVGASTRTPSFREKCPDKRENGVSACTNGYCYLYSWMDYPSNKDLEKLNCNAWSKIEQQLERSDVDCSDDELSYCVSAEDGDCYIGMINDPVGSADIKCALRSDNCTKTEINKIGKSLCGNNGGSDDGTSSGSSDGPSDKSFKEKCTNDKTIYGIKDSDVTIYGLSNEGGDSLDDLIHTFPYNKSCEAWEEIAGVLKMSKQGCSNGHQFSYCIASSDCYVSSIINQPAIGQRYCVGKSETCTSDHLQRIYDAVCGTKNGSSSLMSLGLVPSVIFLSLFYATL